MTYLYFERRYRIAVWAFSFFISASIILLALMRGMQYSTGNYMIPTSQALNNTLVLSLTLLLVFPGIVEYYNNQWRSAVNKNVPILLRDLSESVRSGLSLIRALEDASTRDYGPISKPLEAAMVRFNLTSDIEGSLRWLGEELIQPAARRMSIILIEAYSTGGRVIEVLHISANLFTSLAEYQNERDAEMRPYTFVVYLGSLVFMAISFIIIAQFLVPLTASSADPLVAQSGLLNNILSINYYKAILFWAAVIEALFSGLIAGKIRTGRVSAGLIHSVILLLLTVVFFNSFSVKGV